MVTQNSANNKTGASGTVLQGQGVGTASDFSTATYPATATGTGTILRADGTNWVATTATYPATTTINQILYSSSANVVGEIATANNGVLITSATGVPSMLAAGTLNYSLTANTSAPPSWQKQRGYCRSWNIGSADPVDGTTYYMATGQTYTIVTTSTPVSRFYCPTAGTINSVYGIITNGGTLGSSETTGVNLRLNDTTNTLIANVRTDSTSNTFNNTSLGVTVAAGDFVNIIAVSPTWVTNPTVIRMSVTVYVE